MAIQYVDVADKTTLDSVKTDTTALKGMGGIKYNATSSKPQVYDVTNSEWVDLNVGGGGGASPTLVVINQDGTMTNKAVTVTSSDGLFTQTKTMTSANYEVYELPWLGSYYITWTVDGVTHSQTAIVDAVGGMTSTACIPTLTVINKNRTMDGKTFTVTKNGTSDTHTFTMTATSSMDIELEDLGTYDVTWGSNPLGSETTETVVISTASGTSIEIEYTNEYPSFSTATDLEIAAMLNLHYRDEIDLSTIWAVGDTRIISLSSMSAPAASGVNTWAAQNITAVIVDFNHTDLATAINGHTKAAITVQTREVLSSAANTAGIIYVNGDSSYDTTFTKWSDLYMRTYLNDEVWRAFPLAFRSVIKQSKHYRHTNYNTSDAEQVIDKLFLPSYPEIFGTASYSYYTTTSPVEGTQFKYYETSANRIKYPNNNGSTGSSATNWWQGSASSYYSSSYGYRWCLVNTSGSATISYGNLASGLAPAFAM